MPRTGLFVVASLALLAASALLRAQTESRGSDYVGNAVCRECHEDTTAAFAETSHAAVLTTPLSKGCEACHGPGRAHAEDPTGSRALRAIRRPSEDRCFVCHSNVVTKEAWETSDLARAGKRCADCHRAHVPHADLLAPYADKRVDSLSSAAAIAEPVGAATCLGCHVLHGESLAGTGHEALARSSPPGDCETCHGAGSLHVESGGLRKLVLNPPRADREAEQETCLACHREVVMESHFIGSEFDRAGLRCTSCHEIHRGPVTAPPGPEEPLRSVEDARARATFVGSELCAACHAQAAAEVAATPHAPLLASRTGGAPGGCESCHGPGSLHVQGAGKKGTILTARAIGAGEAARLCLDCHGSNPRVHGFLESAHARSNVGCASCHPDAAHGRLGPAREEPQTCAPCHRAAVSEFSLPNHHPLFEGGLRCSSCHAVHERTSAIHDLTLRNRACLECHPQYEGPFVFPHEADRVEGCTVCHAPHGSVNRRLLHHRDARTLCLKCHADTPPNHEQRPGSVFRRCLLCHTEIHGSDVDRLLLR